MRDRKPRGGGARMSRNDYIPVAAHPDVRVAFWNYRTDDASGERAIGMKWVGTAEALIAAGIATAEMLAPRGKKGPRPRRPDADDESYSVDRHFLVRGGQPYLCYRIL